MEGRQPGDDARMFWKSERTLNHPVILQEIRMADHDASRTGSRAGSILKESDILPVDRRLRHSFAISLGMLSVASERRSALAPSTACRSG